MQKCSECGATWTIERMLSKCPFCNADLKRNESINTVEDAFAVIIEKHGESVFQSEILLSLFADYAPTLVREKRIIRIAVESGAYRAICETPADERMNVINKYVSILKDSFFIEETWARKVLMWCMDALSQESSDKAHMLIDNTKKEIVSRENVHQNKDTTDINWSTGNSKNDKAEMQMKIATQYYFGTGDFPQSETIAINMLTDVADCFNYVPAMNLLGRIFIRKRDFVNSLLWYCKSAELDDAEGYCLMGFFYHNGVGGVPISVIKEYYFYRKAVLTGNMEVVFSIARRFMYGTGLPLDVKVAYAIFKIAEQNGSVEAKNYVTICKRRLSSKCN